MARIERRRLAARVLAWALWQLFVLAFVFIVYASLFGEYGIYHQPMLNVVGALLALMLAIVAGTVIPWRRWRTGNATRRKN
jgi:hypothetical protein